MEQLNSVIHMLLPLIQANYVLMWVTQSLCQELRCLAYFGGSDVLKVWRTDIENKKLYHFPQFSSNANKQTHLEYFTLRMKMPNQGYTNIPQICKFGLNESHCICISEKLEEYNFILLDPILFFCIACIRNRANKKIHAQLLWFLPK